MKLALISDIHSNIAALDAVLCDIERRGVDRIINLGDSLSGPFAPAETAERLIALNIPTVAGNHDRLLLETPNTDMGLWERWAIDDVTPAHLNWVRSLPKMIDEGDMFFCHATPEDDAKNWLDHRGPDHRLVARDLDGVLARLGPVKADLVACGHTHMPRVVRLPGGAMIVNPGAVGCPAYLDTRMEPNFVQQTGSPDASYSLVEKTPAGWTASLMTVPYDSTDMAKMARDRCAESWAEAVETGWFA